MRPKRKRHFKFNLLQRSHHAKKQWAMCFTTPITRGQSCVFRVDLKYTPNKQTKKIYKYVYKRFESILSASINFYEIKLWCYTLIFFNKNRIKKKHNRKCSFKKKKKNNISKRKKNCLKLWWFIWGNYHVPMIRYCWY